MVLKVATRLDQLEAAQTPTQLVVRWLEEAHGYGGLEAYVGSLVDEHPREFPLNRLLLDAIAGVKATSSRKGEASDGARRRALRETAFRYQLVMGINIATHELVIRQGLVHALITANLGLATSERPTTSSETAEHVVRYLQCCELAVRLVTELMAAKDARASLEGRFLAGHPALFPDDAAAFDDLLYEAQRLAVMALRLAELDGLPMTDPNNEAAVAQRAAVLATDLLEQAKITALEKIGEDRQAAEIASIWLRTRAANALIRAGGDPTRSLDRGVSHSPAVQQATPQPGLA